MCIPAEACAAIAEGCVAMVNTLRYFFPVRGGQNWIEGPRLDQQREDGFKAVAVVVCRLGRRLRLVRRPYGKIGPYRTELLMVLTCFDTILHEYGWRDDPHGPGSMNDPDAWCSSWPVKWPFLPYIRPNLLDALEQAGDKLLQALRRPPPPAQNEPTATAGTPGAPNITAAPLADIDDKEAHAMARLARGERLFVTEVARQYGVSRQAIHQNWSHFCEMAEQLGLLKRRGCQHMSRPRRGHRTQDGRIEAYEDGDNGASD
jgi:hypothetical protein